jgi:putative transposase
MALFRGVKALRKLASIHASTHNHFNRDLHPGPRGIVERNRSTTLAERRELLA